MSDCTLGEVFVYNLARTIENGTTVFHGFGSPLVQLAMHVAKRTHAPDMVLIAGATYGVDPRPPFLTPTTNDWAMDRDAVCTLSIGELFDLAASGRLDRMFLSGLQIDGWGNCNVTLLRGADGRVKLKLPGGGGGANLSCDAQRVTLWTAAHRCEASGGRRRYRLVERCEFVTSLGHRSADGRPRSELGHRGHGPDGLLTELGWFDVDDEGHFRLAARYPDVTVDAISDSTGFELRTHATVDVVPLPDEAAVAIIRELDPLGVHQRELRPSDRRRRFALAETSAQVSP